MCVKANLIIKPQVVIIGNMYSHFFIYSNCEQAWDEKVVACVNFTPACVRKKPQACSQIYLRMRGDFMDFFDEFDELEYLEAMELIDNKNNLLNELESGVNRIREEEIYDELNIIQERLDFLGY